MLNKNMSKSEIEEVLKKTGDFVQIDHLTRFLKTNPPIDIKKFVYTKLAGIYEKRSMFGEAAIMFDQLATNALTLPDKIKNYIQEAEMYVRAGMFEKVDDTVKKAIKEASASDRSEIYLKIKECYKRQAEIYENAMRRSYAVRVYQKLLEMNLNSSEREEIKKKLLNLYEKLGKFEDIRKLDQPTKNLKTRF